jgi:hypothetical protein
LNSIAKTDQQKYNLFDGIEAGLKANKKAFSDVLQNFPLTSESSFYFYDDGVVLVFNPYEVGPYVAGFIEVKVPLKKINITSDVPMFNLNKATLDTLSQGIINRIQGSPLGTNQG